MGNIDVYISYLGTHKLADDVAILPLIFLRHSLAVQQRCTLPLP